MHVNNISMRSSAEWAIRKIGPIVMTTTARIVDTSNAGLWIDVGPDCIDLTPGKRYSAIKHHRRKIVAGKRINRNTIVFLVTKGHLIDVRLDGFHFGKFLLRGRRIPAPSPFDPEPTKALPSTA